MPLEPPTPGSPEDWLRHARSDLALAQQWQVPDVLLVTLCFHAQQTVEKSLKAVMVGRDVTARRAHEQAQRERIASLERQVAALTQGSTRAGERGNAPSSSGSASGL